MKYLFIIFSIFLTACKTGEGIDNEYSNIRMDGIYIGKTPLVSTKPDTINGVIIPRYAVKIIRFYNMDSCVVIPESMPQNFQMNDSATIRLYSWCQEYETRNTIDKDFVNVKFKLYGKDSIKFSQITPSSSIDYIGKVYKDSIFLNYSLHHADMNPSPPKPIGFKFYTLKKK